MGVGSAKLRGEKKNQREVPFVPGTVPVCPGHRPAQNVYVYCRVFLNLWFTKPMVWVRVAFHENDGNHENDENDEDNSDSYKQGVECWIHGNHGNHENDENHENPGCKPLAP